MTDTIRRGRSTAAVLILLAGCDSGSSPVPVTTIAVSIEAGVTTGTLQPLWGDHYDLSYTHLAYAAEPGLVGLVQTMQPRSWRCSVGRWEIGMTPPPGGDSTDPATLQTVEREFYRGANTLLAADDPANYDFAYLDDLLTALGQTGAEPYLCFDYMPFTLSSEQDPFNADNLGLAAPQLSFSNGIRTAPPADPAVYARVVRNTVRHVRGLFAGTTDYGITRIEVGNEPDLIDGTGAPLNYFWTGSRAQWIAMYDAVAAEIDADPSLTSLVSLGGGSFAFQPGASSPTFLQDFLVDVQTNGTRLDFVSYHSYSDNPVDHFTALSSVQAVVAAVGLGPEIVNAEWGRELNGDDPVYDRIEHGLFRTKVMILMQLFGVRFAHEALVRDVAPGAGNLGVLTTGPATRKPVADAYLALNILNGALQAVQVTVPPGQYAMAGRDVGGTRIVVVFVGDDPGAGARTEVGLSVANLPWGAAPFDAHRYEVSEATWAAGGGPVRMETRAGLSGGSFAGSVTFGPGPGAGQLVVWELVAQ